MPVIRYFTALLFLSTFGLFPLVLKAESASRDLPVEVIPNIKATSESLALSPDGNFLLSGEYNGEIKLWEMQTGRLVRRFMRHANGVRSIVFIESGAKFLSVSEDMMVKLWETATGKLLRTTELRSPAAYFWDIKLSPDGKRVITSQTIKATDQAGVIKLWNAETGQVIRTFRATPMNLAFSADGSQILSGGSGIDYKPNGQLTLWDAASGKLIRSFEGHKKFSSVSKVAISPDGKHIVSVTSLDAVRMWDVGSGRAVTLATNVDNVYTLAYLPDSKTLMTGDQDGTVNLWDAASGRQLKSLKRKNRASVFMPMADGLHALIDLEMTELASGKVTRTFGAGYGGFEAQYSDDGSMLLSNGNLRRWDASNGQLVSTAEAPATGAWVASQTPDRKRVVWQMDQRIMKVIDMTTGEQITTIDRGENYYSSAKISPDGKLIAGGDSKLGMMVWDADTGKLLRSVKHPDSVNAVAFSPDSKRLVSGTNNGIVQMWEAASGQRVWSYKDGASVAIVWQLEFSRDGTRVLAPIDETPKLLDATTGRLIRPFEGHKHGYITTFATFSRDGSRMLSSSHDETTRLWDVASGRLLRTFDTGSLNSAAFSPDGKRALLNGDIYNLDSGEKIISMISSNDTDWLAITPEGYFAASEHGADVLSVVRGLEVYSVDQFYQSLYRPDLVREKLAGDPRGLVRAAATSLDLTKALASGEAPAVRILSPQDGAGATAGVVTVEAEVSDRGGGSGRVEWRINGVTSGIDTPASSTASQPVRLSRAVTLDPGNNSIEIVAYNAANLISSVPARLDLAAQAAAPVAAPQTPAPTLAPAPSIAAKPRLFVLVAGVNDYADKRIKLSYAVSDAREVARGFNESGGSLYASIDVKLAIDTEVTRDKLDAAFAEIAGKTQPSDVFVLYLAGHGKTVDGRYYFIPQDFVVDGELNEKTINETVKAKAIAQEQWQRWFASIPARKSVMLFDTCDSGTLTGDASETQQLERGAANDRLAQATGRSILTASGGSEEALEGYRGHGLFTYELLEAIAQADGDNNGTVELTELAAYIYGQVAELSQKVFNQRQVPQMKITANYPLAMRTRILHDDPTPVAEAKPNYQLAQTAQLQIQPSAGATVVRSLSATTAVTVLESKNGWSLIASDGKALGYVATRDLTPVR